MAGSFTEPFSFSRVVPDNSSKGCALLGEHQPNKRKEDAPIRTEQSLERGNFIVLGNNGVSNTFRIFALEE